VKPQNDQDIRDTIFSIYMKITCKLIIKLNIKHSLREYSLLEIRSRTNGITSFTGR
jgi:hypothetical protein